MAGKTTQRKTAATAAVSKKKSSPTKNREEIEKDEKDFKQWGRAWQVSTSTLLGCLFILTVCPFIPTVFYITCHHFGGSLRRLLDFLMVTGLDWSELYQKFPSLSSESAKIYFGWVLFQILLNTLPDVCHYLIPRYRGGVCDGAITPAGKTPQYNINGLQAWIITHALWFANIYHFQLFRPAELFERMGHFSVICNASGYILASLAYLKACVYPTVAADCKFSGSFVYDYLMGVEFHPRVGKWFDFKLFFNGRPGIVAWTLIDLSAASYQLEQYGKITDSMILVNILHVVYVVDFFWNEAWYLKTIDICHEHFGWYLAWGDLAWLPFVYPLQALYLAYNPVELGETRFYSILALGLIGFFIFRSSNSQKDAFRKNPKEYKIAGQLAKYIKCSFLSSDGKRYESTLLTSGWWGVGRHMNYTGDLMGSLAYCLCCGFEHLLPYFYIIYMSILLLHRIYRDEHRLKAKYGNDWDKYTSVVPYRLLPGIY